MKQSYQLLYMVLFLSIIGALPVIQTIHEYRSNERHRIQMLDIVEDIFVTPGAKATKDALLADDIARAAGILDYFVNDSLQSDSTRAVKKQAAIRAVDRCLNAVGLLKSHVVNYNRHLKDENNIYAARDTSQPYFGAVCRLQATCDTLLTKVAAGAPPIESSPILLRLRADLAFIKAWQARDRGFAGYARRTLTALRRILVGADYLRPYEKEMEKVSLFANGIRPWMLLGYYGIFGDLGEKAVPGRNDWFFYRPDVDFLVKPPVDDERSLIVDPNDIATHDSIIDTIVTFKNQLAERGIDLLVVVMPTKASIYPDLLTPAMNAALSGTFSHSLGLLRRLESAGVATVNLFPVFAQERCGDVAAGDSLYLHTDTHFKGRGVLAAAQAVASRVKTYPWFAMGTQEFAVDTVVVARSGDIGEMTTLPAVQLRTLLLSFPLENTTCYPVYRIDRDDTGAVASRTLYEDDFQRSDILVLGDSFSRIYQTDEPFGAGWIAHLAREIGRPVASLVNDGGASTLVRKSLARKKNMLRRKKLVIWQFVERDFRFGSEGWKNVNLDE
jgi:hypothetical protein